MIKVLLPLATAIAAVTAAGVAIYQANRSRLTTAADILLKMEDRFFVDDDLLLARSNAAKALRNPDNQESDKDAEELFDFFETVGLLTRKEILDDELAWNSFYYWTHGYFTAGKKFLDRQNAISENRYREAIWLFDRLETIEKSKSKINEDEWKGFLDDEESISINGNR